MYIWFLADSYSFTSFIGSPFSVPNLERKCRIAGPRNITLSSHSLHATILTVVEPFRQNIYKLLLDYGEKCLNSSDFMVKYTVNKFTLTKLILPSNVG